MKTKWLSIKTKLSDKDILQLENDLKISLPLDYKTYIKNVNGAALKKAVYIDRALGRIPYSRNVNLSKTAKSSIYNIFDSFDTGSKQYFPFGSVGNGDYFCFDLKTGNVILYTHENSKVYPICKTFTELINSLSIEE